MSADQAQAPAPTEFLWLDLTRKCQLECVHCYNASGPAGGHGAMTRDDWVGVLDQAAGCGVRGLQFIGGEPTLHPDFAVLVDRALDLGLDVEVYSNLVHVPPSCWALFQRPGVRLATSYYSEQAATHDAVTGRPTHRRTRANIATAVRLGIPLRVGVVTAEESPHAGTTRRDLETLGVTRIGVDHVRPFGRAAHGQAPRTSALCGRCGTGRAAVGPGGDVTPCVFSDWMAAGNVRSAPLADILAGPAMRDSRTLIKEATEARNSGRIRPCEPDRACDPYLSCAPDNRIVCQPDDSGTCTPGECAPTTPPAPDCMPQV